MTTESCAEVLAEGDTVTIRVSGTFGFPLYRQFREACQCGARGSRFVIDLAHTRHIDSSALGMLLLLREQAGGDDARVEIVHCSEPVRRILASARFERLFRIS